jgi:DNA (cytosine-5)-methyltransferase 1
MEAGYNVRFQIIDLAGHQLPQRRLRLLFNMAKVGFPLAPFPNPTNGPPGSGLDRYITIADALKELERIPRGHRNDPLHQPGSQKRYNEKLCDPNITLAKTLTGNGGENFHYSGKRKYTPRENSALQTFPWNASFNGSATSANEQIGNAYPCKPAAQHFLASAQTHEAFEAGFIDGEEDIRDLWETLNDKGINIAKEDTRYRYLTRLEKNKARPSYVPDCILARELKIGPLRFRHRPDVTMPPSRGRNRPQQLPVRAETVEDGRVVYWVPDDDD